jgi:transposase
VIELRSGTRIWIAAGFTDLRRGFQGLTALIETVLEQAPYSGHVFVFRGRRGDLIKLLWWDGDGLCLFQKRLERGRFIWPQATSGIVALTRAQLSMLLEGIGLAPAAENVGATVGRISYQDFDLSLLHIHGILQVMDEARAVVADLAALDRMALEELMFGTESEKITRDRADGTQARRTGDTAGRTRCGNNIGYFCDEQANAASAA